jgi:hypothetical protein
MAGMDLRRQRIHEIFGGGGMSNYVCPLNKRACRCDPEAPDKKLQPCMLTKRISKLFRLLGSDYLGEVNSATDKLKQLVSSEGLTFNDLAILIENCDGQIEEKKYSDADAEQIYAMGQKKGMEKGRVEEARKRELPPEFFDADGYPQWNAIALFCQRNINRLHSEWERTFVDDMTGKTLCYAPTEKQAKHLLAIYVKLGGKYDPKAAHIYR